MRVITRSILILSLVSLFTDMASEMLYPVMPVYLESIGYSVFFIGLLEGVAEAVAGLSKGYFGNWSDVTGRRIPFVQAGYAMSALSKPILAFFTSAGFIFSARTIDRLGKGVRTGARDAMLSDQSTKETKGRVFGFHRAMDTLGAVIGPVFALWYLYQYPGQYRLLFLIAFLPGLAAVACTFILKEKKIEPKSPSKPGLLDFVRYWKTSPVLYRKLVAGLLVFAIINSSDVFLLLKMKESGFEDSFILKTYILYNLVYAISSYPLGALADKIGFKKILISGLLIFAIVYFGMSYAHTGITFLALFFIYGIYAAATEGVSKAWITNISSPQDTATSIGTFTAFQSLCSLLASSLAGLIWYSFGSFWVFIYASVVSVLVAGYLFTVEGKLVNGA